MLIIFSLFFLSFVLIIFHFLRKFYFNLITINLIFKFDNLTMSVFFNLSLFHFIVHYTKNQHKYKMEAKICYCQFLLIEKKKKIIIIIEF